MKLSWFACVVLAASTGAAVAATPKPNIVFILADDKYLPSDQNDCVCRDFGVFIGIAGQALD